jgi:hypothetical protein
MYDFIFNIQELADFPDPDFYSYAVTFILKADPNLVTLSFQRTIITFIQQIDWRICLR